MASKKVKRKNKAQAKAMQTNAALVNSHAEKAYIGGNYFNFGGAANVDMRPDETGVAQAYTLNVAVSKAIEFWELWLDGLKWEIRDETTDKVLIDSDMRHFPKLVAGSKLAQAIDYHEQCFKHSLFKSIAFSDWLHSETYIRFIANDWGFPTSLEWLNPLAVEPMIYTGYITEYRYAAMPEYLILKPKQVAYRIAKRNAQNDLRGTSRVLLAIEDLNIDANEKRALRNYFKNGMLLGGLISPVDQNASLSPAQVMKLEDDLERKNKGVGNAHRFAIAPSNMQIETFTPPDIEKAYSIIQPLRDTILMAMGVYPQLAGDPSNANFDSAYDIKRQWWEVSGIPYAKEIEGFINKLILPTLEPNSPCYFAFDYTPYEVEKPEVVSQDFDAGIIDMYQAAELRGYEGDTDLKGIYLINKVPMAKEIIVKLANTIPSQYALDYANAASAGQTPNVNADTAIGGVKPIANNEIINLPDGGTIEPAVGNEQAIEAALNNEAVGTAHKHEHTHDLPAIVDTPDIEALDELQACRKFYSNGKSLKRPFEQVALRGDIGDAIQAALETHDKQTILDAFKSAHDKLSVKAIQATRLDFEGDFDELLKRARSEKMGRVQWASAMRAIIRRYGLKAYVDGLMDGGVEDEPSEDDRIAINELSASNSGYVTELGNVLYKSDTELSDGQADIKAAMWYNKTIDGFYQAGLISADANGIYEWAYGKTESHCSSCLRLNGQRHRLRRWKANIMPKSEDLECGGWLCDCNLIKVRGRERGNY